MICAIRSIRFPPFPALYHVKGKNEPQIQTYRVENACPFKQLRSVLIALDESHFIIAHSRERQRRRNSFVTFRIDFYIYIGYDLLCIAVGWGNSAHFGIQSIWKGFSRLRGNHEAGGSIARSGLLGLETVEKMEAFLQDAGRVAWRSFFFFEDNYEK